MQEVLHAIADKHRKQPKRPQLVGLHGRVPHPCLVALMKDCWHPVSTPRASMPGSVVSFTVVKLSFIFFPKSSVTQDICDKGRILSSQRSGMLARLGSSIDMSSNPLGAT